MGELALTAPPALPAERHYRPTGRARYYARSLPLALGVGVGAGMLVMAAPFDPLLTVLAVWGVVIWRLVRTRKRAQQIARANDEAQALLAAGDLHDAAGRFEALCRQGTNMPGFHSLLVYNRAVAYIREGELDRASALLHAVLGAGWLSQRGSPLGSHTPMVFSALAACTALQGLPYDARYWREKAHANISDAKRGQLLAIDVLVDGRSGDLDALVKRVDDALPRAENLMTASQLRLIRLLKAFALEQGETNRYRAESHRAEIDVCLAAGRPARPEELRHVADNWPEFREFLILHGILDNAA